MNKLPISAIILTLNEEINIAECIESIHSWVDEIFIVDSGSQDRTVEIVQQYTPHTVFHEWINYAKQRNWAQTNLPLSHEWILHLDAGERVMPELARVIQNTFQKNLDGVDGFLMPRRTVFLGRWIKHGGIYPTYHLRLYRRQKGRCEDREYDQHYVIDGPTQVLTGDLIDNVTNDLASWTRSHERWASSEAAEYLKRQVSAQQVQPRFLGSHLERRRWFRQRIYGKFPLFVRPFVYFVVRYILLFGFLDGTQGLIYHFLHACWYRFYVDAKIWEKQYKIVRERDI